MNDAFVSVCCQSSESIDVYCFGHLLYEMTYGRPPDSVPIDEFPDVPYTAVGMYAMMCLILEL